MRILIAEDERDLNRTIQKKLKSEGHVVDCCFDGISALDYLTIASYDVAILDIMMPGMDGFQVLRQARQAGVATPVIFLTARDTVEDKVQGLDLGANDYMVKPFSLMELLARIRAVTRNDRGNATNVIQIGDLVMDSAARAVSRGGESIVLTTKEYALLEVLIRNRGQVLSRSQIMDYLWEDGGGSAQSVDVYVRYLRRKIDDPYAVKLIETVRGAGYVIR